MSRTVTLPIVAPSETIGDAYSRLEQYGRSGVVAMDDRGPLVITARMLDYFEKSSKDGTQTPISHIAESLFAATDLPGPSRWDNLRSSLGRSLGIAAPPVPRRSNKEALGQDDYSVLDVEERTATVIPRDPWKGEELSQPFRRGASPARLA